MDAFSRYAPFIQEYIFRAGWEKLRAVQVAAADAIFNSEDNVLISASTASGKTEAAFFPVLTLLEENPPASVGAIYIAPLKALINDQFTRMTALCEPAGIRVWRWHGDVGQSQKAKLLKHPSGILQITPESLEALMLHKHAMIPALFRDLRFVIIDEVHSLLRGDRGGQTLCLIERLSDLSGAKPRRIGLSATIGDIEQTAVYLGKARVGIPSSRRSRRRKVHGGSQWSIFTQWIRRQQRAKRSMHPSRWNGKPTRHRLRQIPPTDTFFRIRAEKNVSYSSIPARNAKP